MLLLLRRLGRLRDGLLVFLQRREAGSGSFPVLLQDVGIEEIAQFPRHVDAAAQQIGAFPVPAILRKPWRLGMKVETGGHERRDREARQPAEAGKEIERAEEVDTARHIDEGRIAAEALVRAEAAQGDLDTGLVSRPASRSASTSSHESRGAGSPYPASQSEVSPIRSATRKTVAEKPWARRTGMAAVRKSR